MSKKPLSVRQVRVVWNFAIIFAVFCIVFGGFTRKPFEGHLDWRHSLMLGFAAWSGLGGFSIRQKLLNSASAKRSNPTASSKTWTAAQLIGIAVSESIVLWGLVSDIVIESPRWLSGAFYVVGILLFFKFKPLKPLYLA